MNTFEQHIGRPIKRVLRLDTGTIFPPPSLPLAIYLMFEETSGLLISFGSHNYTTTMGYMTLADLQEEYGVEWGECCLNEPEPSDKLNKMIGQVLTSIKVGQVKEDKLLGDNFIIRENEYAGVFIQTTTESIVIYSTNQGGHILFDKAKLPQTDQNYTIQ